MMFGFSDDDHEAAAEFIKSALPNANSEKVMFVVTALSKLGAHALACNKGEQCEIVDEAIEWFDAMKKKFDEEKRKGSPPHHTDAPWMN